MTKEILKESTFAQDIVTIIRSGYDREQLVDRLKDYHEKDIAQSLELLTNEERKSLYDSLDPEWISNIFSYIEEPEEYIQELGIGRLAEVINEMDSDDAVDLLEDVDEKVKNQLRPILDEDLKADIRLINSYDDDEIGSLITNNYISISRNLTIRQAMHELVQQAGEKDNISTLCGAIDLKDLIIAREHDELDDIIIDSYPYLIDHEKISECIEDIKDYAEDSLPVLNGEKKIIGILTAQDVIEAVDDEMGDDYAKLAGLTAEEDLKETTFESMKKRMPWLIILLFLGMGVSTVVGAFEGVVAVLPIARGQGDESWIWKRPDPRSVVIDLPWGIYRCVQRFHYGKSVYDIWLCWCITASGNGNIKSGWNPCTYVLSQDQG